MKILSASAVVLGLAVLCILVYAATRPDTFRVQRSATIQAPPEKIFPFINDLQRWRAWSPWENIDPALRRSYSGPASGKGAAYAWEGNKDVGSGRMEIDESTPSSRIVLKLHFMKPFEARNVAEYTLVPEGGATRVTWVMYGPNSFPGKLIGVFMDMDAMVGGKFEEGLANLRSIAEK